MHLIQRKYKIVRALTLKELSAEVNELLEHEYKDTEGYLYVSSGRWQCLGAVAWFLQYSAQTLAVAHDGLMRQQHRRLQ